VQNFDQRPTLLFLHSVIRYIIFDRSTDFPASRYFLKTITSQYPSFYVIAQVVSTVLILVDIDLFALPSHHPSISAPPPPTVSHRISVLLIISRTPRLIRAIQHLAFEYEDSSAVSTQISVSKMGWRLQFSVQRSQRAIDGVSSYWTRRSTAQMVDVRVVKMTVGCSVRNPDVDSESELEKMSSGKVILHMTPGDHSWILLRNGVCIPRLR